MFCTKCGNKVDDGLKFCTKCGAPMGASEAPGGAQATVAPQQNVQPQVSQSVPATSQQNGTQVIQQKKLDFIKVFMNIFIKPYNTIEENNEELSKIGNSMIIAGIVSGVIMLLNLITYICSLVYLGKYSYNGKMFDFGMLQYVDWFNIIIKRLIMYFAIIVALGFVVYIAGLIIKKEIKFPKAVSIVALGLVPFLIGKALLSPILTLIWDVLGTIVVYATEMYSIVIIYELINKNFDLSENKKIYTNASIFAIFMLVIYLIEYLMLK